MPGSTDNHPESTLKFATMERGEVVTRLPVVLTLLVSLAACSVPTEGGSTNDPSRLPYVVSPAGVRIHGTSRLLVIPTRFADGPASPLTSSDIAAQLFSGATGGAGPLAETYSLASGGTFTLRGDVTRWVTTSVTFAAANARGVITESGLGDHTLLALQAVDADVDFGLYDNDGPDGIPNSGDDDGIVDGGVVILHSEPNEYCDASVRGTHPVSVTQWRPNGARFRTQDPSRKGRFIEVGAYTILSATGCSSSIVQSHVLAHELGHLARADIAGPVMGAQGSRIPRLPKRRDCRGPKLPNAETAERRDSETTEHQRSRTPRLPNTERRL